MTQNMDDVRVRRTRELLQEALLKATIEKGFTNVTVRDITDRARVNRSTFYRHYLDKYDLLREYMERVYGQVPTQEQASSPTDRSNDSLETPPEWLVGVLKHVQRNADFYRVMLGQKGDPAFCAQSFRKYIETQFRGQLSREAQTDSRRPPIDLSVSYIASAAMGVMAWWLEKGQPYTPEQLALWLDQLSMGDLRLSMGQEGHSAVRE